MNLRFEKARLADIPQMQAMVQEYVKNDIILFRNDDEIANAIRSYTLAKSGDELVGFSALHIFSANLAEIRMLVVRPGYQKMGVGRQVVGELLKEARALGLKKILALTYATDFFVKLGFYVVQKRDIPEAKVWEDCIKCKRFPECGEVSLMMDL